MTQPLRPFAACQHADALCPHRGRCGDAVGRIADGIGTAIMGGVPDGFCGFVGCGSFCGKESVI